jgi:hypothetical protein
MSEEIIAEKFKECRLTMDNVCASLASDQIKMKRNAFLWRQVKNINRRNWSLRKTIRVLRFQVRPEA